MARTDTHTVSCCELEDSPHNVVLCRVGRATFYLCIDKLHEPVVAVEFKMVRYALAEVGHNCFIVARNDFTAEATYSVATNEILLSFYDNEESPRHNEAQYRHNEEPQKANRILLLCH